MCDLQAIIEFSIELNKFINIDLFQRGFYQIRVSHRINSKIIHKIELNFCETESLSSSPKSSSSDLSNGSNNVVFPQCIVNGSAVSKTFQVMYKNEEIILNDVITFKTHLIVDASQCVEQIRNTVFLLDIELWFSDQSFGPQHHKTIERVSSRQLTLHFDVCRGLHYNLPVIFDYFHLSAVTITIHASLITLCQPFLRTKQKSVNGKGIPSTSSYNLSSSYDTLLFGCSLSALNGEQTKNNEQVLALRLRRAQLIHWQLCSILLTAILSLHRKMKEYIHLLPPWTQAKCQSINTTLRSETLSPLGQRCYKDCLEISLKSSSYNLIAFQNQTNSSDSSTDQYSNPKFKPEDIVASVDSDVSYLCGSAIILWQQFLKVVLHNDKINQHLAKVHHLQRIKRFSEAFFVIEKQKHQLCAICDNNTLLFNEISECLRKSSYLSKLPHCDVECVPADGDPSTLPVIYEEKFDQDLDLIERCSASLSDIRLEDEERCNSFIQKSNSECIYPQKKNLKDKLFNNFTRMNLGYGRLKEEFPANDDHYANVENSFIEERECLSESSATQNVFRDAVTLVAFTKKCDDFCGKSLKKSRVKETFSLYNIKSSTARSMSTSESLPDLSNNWRRNKSMLNCRVSPSTPESSPTAASSVKSKWHSRFSRKLLLKPPPKFRDDKNKYSVNNEFQGTVYFPKPPPQFSVEETSSEEDEEEDVTPTGENSSDATPTGTRPSSRNNEIDPLPNDFEIEAVKKEEEDEEEAEVVEEEKCTILDMFKNDQCLVCGESECSCEIADEEASCSAKRASAITYDLITFVKAKEEFRQQISSKTKGWNFYSDFPSLASRIPYFQCDSDFRAFSPEGLHLVICVHGLDGNSADLRLVKTYLELGLPTTNFEFLMSQRNQGETFDNFDVLTDRLVQEITCHIDVYGLNPAKISFIGHSLGNVIIRAALTRPAMQQWIPKLNTFLSLSGPHLGTAYNTSGLVNMGLWFMQKWKKSESLLQLTMRDANDPRQTYLYKLSETAGLEYFRHVLLCGSSQDNYVPIHSAHIELCNAALNDTSINGIAYREMVSNLLQPLMNKSTTKLIRYDVHHSLTSNANSLIGRAAHIAVLDSELFIEKFMVVVGLKYFA